MGSFSFTRAENTTARANLTEGDKYKILIPQEFGGGYILDTYFDYGIINDSCDAVYINSNGDKHELKGKYDLYGLLYYLNASMNDYLTHSGDKFPVEKPERNFTDLLDILENGGTDKEDARCRGIEMGCYDNQIDYLKFPLKLVSRSYSLSYEDCKGKSYSDPNQGFFRGYWNHKDYERFIIRRCSVSKRRR